MTNEIKVPLQPVQTTRASEEIYNQIRKLILDGDILPGEHLPSERRMMEMMQRSRPTIREAMRMLEREGYIRTQPGSSGAVVQELNEKNVVQSLETMIRFQKLSIRDILEFRQTTECDGICHAADRRDDTDIAALHDILGRAADSIGDADAFMNCDLEFHLALAKASRNAMYVIMTQVCRGTVGETLALQFAMGSPREQSDRYLRVLKEHQAVCAAVEAGDGEEARRALSLHLINAAKDIL